MREDPTLPEPRIDLQRPVIMAALELANSIYSTSGPCRGPVCVQSDQLPESVVRWLGPGFRFRLERDFWLAHPIAVIEIPAGFVFDGASVPRPAWLAISPTELGVVAPLVHDWLYRTGGQFGQFTRAEADRIFLEHMKAEGVPAWKRWAAYLAVRAGGRGSWKDRGSAPAPALAAQL